MCNEGRYFIRKRDRCFKRVKRTLSAQDKLFFFVARREANRAKRNAKKRFQAKVVDSLSDPNLDVRKFLKISNRILDDKSIRKFPPLLENNNLVLNDTQKADILNNHFASIASLDHDMPLPRLPDFQFDTYARIDTIETTEIEVKRLLTRLSVHKTIGPDGIGMFLQFKRREVNLTR